MKNPNSLLFVLTFIIPPTLFLQIMDYTYNRQLDSELLVITLTYLMVVALVAIIWSTLK